MEMMTQMPATELLMPLAAYKGKKRWLVVVGVVVAAIVLDLVVHLAGRDGAVSPRKTSPYLQTSILLQNTHNQHRGIEHIKQAAQAGLFTKGDTTALPLKTAHTHFADMRKTAQYAIVPDTSDSDAPDAVDEQQAFAAESDTSEASDTSSELDVSPLAQIQSVF